jgi:thiaminase/transcriptional activator TenA
MTLSDEMRNTHHDLWERMVTHPFVLELGEGTLPVEKFARYFVQDYVFVSTLAKVVGLAVAKAPSLEAAQPLSPFLHTLLNAEKNLFFRAFEELGVAPADYLNAVALPAGQAVASFMLATAYDGTFDDIVTTLLVTEWTYYDWATRLAQAGKQPPHRMYREWIDIHAAQELGDFVTALRQHVDTAAPSDATPRLNELFGATLRYECQFWDMAYHGEELA